MQMATPLMMQTTTLHRDTDKEMMQQPAEKELLWHW
jgi:hypothetical protein